VFVETIALRTDLLRILPNDIIEENSNLFDELIRAPWAFLESDKLFVSEFLSQLDNSVEVYTAPG
jgi:hypothetical protein